MATGGLAEGRSFEGVNAGNTQGAGSEERRVSSQDSRPAEAQNDSYLRAGGNGPKVEDAKPRYGREGNLAEKFSASAAVTATFIGSATWAFALFAPALPTALDNIFGNFGSGSGQTYEEAEIF